MFLNLYYMLLPLCRNTFRPRRWRAPPPNPAAAELGSSSSCVVSSFIAKGPDFQNDVRRSTRRWIVRQTEKVSRQEVNKMFLANVLALLRLSKLVVRGEWIEGCQRHVAPGSHALNIENWGFGGFMTSVLYFKSR